MLPPGVNLISLIERNIANVGDDVAYRYLDHTGSADGHAVEMTWSQLGRRLRAIGATLQRIAARGDRVAVLAPQGLDYIAGFFAAIKAGMIAVPLFAPELQGHAERLDIAMRDARPSAVLTTAAAAERPRLLAQRDFGRAVEIVVVDEVPDSAGADFTPVTLDVDDVSHLQYTSGSTRSPVGVEITHRNVGTNLLQMILSIDLLDRNTHGVSWLPLYHDMGLSMIGFPAVYGGHSTLLSPTAFIRRPQRWIRALSDGSRRGRVVTAAHNIAYEYTAQRGLPERRRGCRPEQRRDDHRLRAGEHRRDPRLRGGLRAVRASAAGDQAVVRHRRGDAVRVDHRTVGACGGGAPRPRRCWPRAGRCRRTRAPTPTRPSRRCPVARWRAASGR